MRLFALGAAALLASCAPQPVETPARRDAPPELPRHEQAIDAGRSLIVIEVRRGGSLARFGHDHVVSARNIVGSVAPREGRADLYVALDGLVVDEPTLREAAGFETQPSESDIAGTRANMLGVLEADKFPWALVHIARSGDRLATTITLHGVTRTFHVPASVSIEGEQTAVSGKLAFNQTDFGIKPLSLLGGAVQVQDGLVLSFTIHASRL